MLGSPGERRSPPEFLLHGTPAGTVASVLATGLRSMNRAFVHLTSDPDYAAQVAAAKGGGVVLRVRAKAAADDGVEFLLANPHVWLVRHVPAAYLGSDGPNDVARRPRNSARGVVG
ncbi:MAG: RNA 2'-phosphotransferase [Gemmataceae bacterium]|nr:RNA 2'-phosphotransferase [Gemmataceae bacterium]